MKLVPPFPKQCLFSTAGSVSLSRHISEEGYLIQVHYICKSLHQERVRTWRTGKHPESDPKPGMAGVQQKFLLSGCGWEQFPPI